MSLMSLPPELILIIAEALDERALGRLSATSKIMANLVEPVFWRETELTLASTARLNAEVKENICRNLKRHTQLITLSTSCSPESQEMFQAVLQPRVARNLGEAFGHSPGNWVSSLKEVQLPLQTTFDSGKYPSEPVSATITLKGKAQNAAKTGIHIQVQGEQLSSCRRSKVTGTSYDMFQSLIKGVGPPYEWEEMELKGNRSCDACVGNTISAMVINSELLKIQKLTLTGFDFEHLRLTEIHRLDFASVQDLTIRDCSNLPVLFRYFMQDPTKIALEDLTCEMWHLQEPAWYEDEHNIENFLCSFSGLKHLKIHVQSEWSLDFDAITAAHSALETFEFSAGNIDFQLESIDAVANNLHSLKRLAFRMSSLEELISTGKMGKERKRRTTLALRKLEALWGLTDVVMVFRPPAMMGQPARVEKNMGIAANEIYNMLGNDKIQHVRLWMRALRYRPGSSLQFFIPEPCTFTY
ncbi:hypothetical protein DM02DRAFT_652106 [Periconia macrospinosa]|uniref:F-box domain-containing protein n=1 Tax=Periconia macrospinosa TaxID=97972 RepID=A0A2V1E149_9PLEO|nr:hypothetical protein DM02DRAFT_652106 [Periconia macrospinosa]